MNFSRIIYLFFSSIEKELSIFLGRLETTEVGESEMLPKLMFIAMISVFLVGKPSLNTDLQLFSVSLEISESESEVEYKNVILEDESFLIHPHLTHVYCSLFLIYIESLSNSFKTLTRNHLREVRGSPLQFI
ncbi:hypothetical protein P3G55_12075 [Leptospira sp. 96542]|nr:hypothetical protein [Leptospira sp. 96542]